MKQTQNVNTLSLNIPLSLFSKEGLVMFMQKYDNAETWTNHPSQVVKKGDFVVLNDLSLTGLLVLLSSLHLYLEDHICPKFVMNPRPHIDLLITNKRDRILP